MATIPARCPGCNTLLAVEADPLAAAFAERGLDILGSHRCSMCGVTLEMKDIYSGKFTERRDHDLSVALQAARDGDSKALGKMLAKRVDPNATQATGEISLLHIAATYGHTEIACLLVDKGAAVDARSTEGKTPLCFAVTGGNVAVAAALLEKGADPNARDASGYTPFHLACAEGHLELVELLICSGKANVQDRTDKGTTPLHLAAVTGEVRIAELLAEAGADIDSRDAVGATPLLYSASRGIEGAVTYLLAAGADANLADKSGTPPIAYARAAGAERVADILASQGGISNSEQIENARRVIGSFEYSNYSLAPGSRHNYSDGRTDEAKRAVTKLTTSGVNKPWWQFWR